MILACVMELTNTCCAYRVKSFPTRIHVHKENNRMTCAYDYILCSLNIYINISDTYWVVVTTMTWQLRLHLVIHRVRVRVVRVRDRVMVRDRVRHNSILCPMLRCPPGQYFIEIAIWNSVCWTLWHIINMCLEKKIGYFWKSTKQ
jgi:hypothetical protein